MKKLYICITFVFVAAIPVLIFATTTGIFDTPTYNPDMTDWWDDMIEALGDKSSMIWTEPGWDSDVWVEIENIGTDKYRISLYGIAASGEAISYTITETDDGYYKYGPMKKDGTMDSRNYVKSLGSQDADI